MKRSRRSWQYRVTWRRRDWSPTGWDKGRTFGTWPATVDFIDKLQNEWPGASPVTDMRVDRRVVELWERVDAGTGEP